DGSCTPRWRRPRSVSPPPSHAGGAFLSLSSGIAMRSDLIKSGPDRAPARAMLRATGLDDEAIARPLVAVVHTWSNVSPCNLNLRELAVEAAAGIRAAGGTPVEFNTIAVTDG